jgi:hypothetical protein
MNKLLAAEDAKEAVHPISPFNEVRCSILEPSFRVAGQQATPKSLAIFLNPSNIPGVIAYIFYD